VAKGQRGCIVFTSSAAAAIASPFTALYAATKSFLSTFGASLAVEVRHRGIDVLVFHPSPVATRCAAARPPPAGSEPPAVRAARGARLTPRNMPPRRFYDRAHRLDVLAFFQARAVHPDALPAAVLRCVGRTVWADLGPTALGFRLAMKLVDYNLLATVSALAAPMLPDFRKALAAKKAA
jgi:NAD(P)-dependent dehydrogenase (short-subunit alcohol dehydrogenase family)